ncbi:MAG TPA: short-chain dehydrogenase [Chitinophagaceae bacterium]
MTTDMIEKFIDNKGRKGSSVNIHFKERSAVKGMFIRAADYDELKYKNFWRIVINTKVEEWNRTKNMDLCRIFNGLSFTRLSDE